MLNRFLLRNKTNSIAVVCDFSEDNPVKLYATRVSRAIGARLAFADTGAINNIYNPVLRDKSKFNNNIENVIGIVKRSDVTHLHLELGMYGDTLEDMRRNIFNILENSSKLVLFVHSFHIQDDTFTNLYLDIISFVNSINNKSKIWVNNIKDYNAVKRIYNGDIVYYPVTYFSNKIRSYFCNYSKTCINDKANYVDIGMFGYINAHKDFETAIKALTILPSNYRLHIVGGAHPGERQICKKNVSIEKLDEILWKFKDFDIANRVLFYDKLGNVDFFKVMSKMDIVLISFLETYMSASSVLSQAYELKKSIVATRCTTFEMAEMHFGRAISFFDPGNSIQLMQVIKRTQRDKVNYSAIFSLEEFVNRINI